MDFIIELDRDLPETELHWLEDVLPPLVEASLALGRVDQRLENLFVSAALANT